MRLKRKLGLLAIILAIITASTAALAYGPGGMGGPGGGSQPASWGSMGKQSSGMKPSSQNGTNTLSQSGAKKPSQNGTNALSQNGAKKSSQDGMNKFSQGGAKIPSQNSMNPFSQSSIKSSSPSSKWSDACGKATQSSQDKGKGKSCAPVSPAPTPASPSSIPGRDKPSGKNGPGMGIPGMGGMDLADIKASISALNDTAAQSSLNILLSAYETALANEKSAIQSKADKATLQACRKATVTARTALQKGLKDASVSPAPASPSSIQGKDKPEKGGTGLNLTNIKASIAALADTGTQASLSSLVTAYETAVDNKKAAVTSNAGKGTVQSYHEATAAAKTALLTGLKDAGISPAPATPSSLPNLHVNKTIWQTMGNWFSHIFRFLFK